MQSELARAEEINRPFVIRITALRARILDMAEFRSIVISRTFVVQEALLHKKIKQPLVLIG
jgi:hypothetical protein